MRKLLLFMFLGCCGAAFADGPHAFPVPFTPGKDASQTKISFTNLPASGTIKIYTIDGRLVADVPIATGSGITDWPATNRTGEKVATGVYIYKVNDEFRGKLVVIR